VFLYRKEFTDADIELILRQVTRVLLNMVPIRLDLALFNSLNDANFLQPLELLSAQSLCDIKLNQPFDVGDALGNIHETPRELNSLLEHFLSPLTE